MIAVLRELSCPKDHSPNDKTQSREMFQNSSWLQGARVPRCVLWIRSRSMMEMGDSPRELGENQEQGSCSGEQQCGLIKKQRLPQGGEHPNQRDCGAAVTRTRLSPIFFLNGSVYRGWLVLSCVTYQVCGRQSACPFESASLQMQGSHIWTRGSCCRVSPPAV